MLRGTKKRRQRRKLSTVQKDRQTERQTGRMSERDTDRLSKRERERYPTPYNLNQFGPAGREEVLAGSSEVAAHVGTISA